MLVLSRRLEESFVIRCPDGSEIKVALLLMDRNKARIGITAPLTHTILRTELIEGYAEAVRSGTETHL